jgi:hypothetical protein
MAPYSKSLSRMADAGLIGPQHQILNSRDHNQLIGLMCNAFVVRIYVYTIRPRGVQNVVKG